MHADGTLCRDTPALALPVLDRCAGTDLVPLLVLAGLCLCFAWPPVVDEGGQELRYVVAPRVRESSESVPACHACLLGRMSMLECTANVRSAWAMHTR